MFFCRNASAGTLSVCGWGRMDDLVRGVGIQRARCTDFVAKKGSSSRLGGACVNRPESKRIRTVLQHDDVLGETATAVALAEGLGLLFSSSFFLGEAVAE